MKKLICFITVTAMLILTACGTDSVSHSSADTDSAADSSFSSVPSEDSSVESELSSNSSDDMVSEDTTEDSSEDEELFVSGDYKYSLVNTVAMIAAYTGKETEIELPAELDGYTVTAIKSGAFADNTKLKKLTVGDTVVNIETGAFNGCTGLEYIHIGSSVATLEVIAFEDCTSLTEFEVAASNTWFSSLDGVLYNGDKTTLLRCPQAVKKEELDLPAGLTLVAEGAFSACRGLKTVKLPEGCTLSPRAFFYCMDLEKAEFGAGLTEIPEKAFFGCVMLKEINVPAGVTKVGNYAYFGCISAASATLPESVTEIGKDVFKSCSALKKINVSGEYCKQWYNETGKSYINT